MEVGGKIHVQHAYVTFKKNSETFYHQTPLYIRVLIGSDTTLRSQTVGLLVVTGGLEGRTGGRLLSSSSFNPKAGNPLYFFIFFVSALYFQPTLGPALMEVSFC